MISPITPPAIEIEIDMTIPTLQSIISRTANNLKEIKAAKKLVTEQQKNLLENDSVLAGFEDTIEPIVQNIKERKAKIKNTPESQKLKAQKAELAQEEKEISETISNHLTNYYSMTNSRSVDTPSGDQADFKIKANFSSKQLELF